MNLVVVKDYLYERVNELLVYIITHGLNIQRKRLF